MTMMMMILVKMLTMKINDNGYGDDDDHYN